MFNFFHKNQDKDVKLLVDQSLGCQSVTNHFLKDLLKIEDKIVRKIELTYFALAVLSYVYLRFSKNKQKEDVLDKALLQVFQKSIPYCGENISFKQAVLEYRERYKDYDKLINSLFKGDGKIDVDSCTSLLIYLYEKTTLDSIDGKMIEITIASPLVSQFIMDDLDFIKKNNL